MMYIRLPFLYCYIRLLTDTYIQDFQAADKENDMPESRKVWLAATERTAETVNNQLVLWGSTTYLIGIVYQNLPQILKHKDGYVDA